MCIANRLKRSLLTGILLSIFWLIPAYAVDLVYLNTPQGADRLVTAKLRYHFFAVQPYLESQQNLAFCGPASIAAVLNSLDMPRPSVGQLYPYSYFTQDNIFTPATQHIKSYVRVSTQGMTLTEITAFLNTLGVKAGSHYGDRLTLMQFRALIEATLARPDSRIIINYNRKPLGQKGEGHLSPLTAYDDVSDSALLLDVAKFKYPPVWIRLADLLEAMQTTDPDSGKSRGLVVVEKQP